jgi:hypothetical protein
MTTTMRSIIGALALAFACPLLAGPGYQIVEVDQPAPPPTPPSGEAEFDIAGATYIAVAPVGYSFSSEQDAQYSTNKANSLDAAYDLVPATPTSPYVINIIGDWSGGPDTTAVALDGCTPTATNYVLIRTIGEARHPGYYDAAKYVLTNTASGTAPLVFSDAYITVRGIQILAGYTAGSQNGVGFNSGAGTNTSMLEECIVVRQTATGASSWGVITNTSSISFSVRNCLFLGFAGGGVRSSPSSGGVIYADNNTIVNCATGMLTTAVGSIRARNNLVYGATVAVATGTFAVGSDYNATDGATGWTVTDAGNIHDRTSQTFVFVNEVGLDYHLSVTDTGARDHGQDLSGVFTRDVDFTTRSGTWSIGADEP